MSLRDQLIHTTKFFQQAHIDKKVTGENSITSLTTPDFIARTFPSSLKAPVQNQAEYVHFTEWSFTLFDRYHATEGDMVVDEAKRMVVSYMDADAEGPAGMYNNEHVQKIKLTDDGKQVKGFDLFMDGQAMMEWMGKLKAKGIEVGKKNWIEETS
ncbi:Uu.00g141630.m01.CDS01 [Anthostomella pinea]|uniref:Uu.00g141630.m01.CDS01 n=1 Tax=Anthostomella pinea TaxID=933095 RepID=A0AAI8YLG6_9PEZI|nr:Uu.00g141630.m01.CDS01 [Anthostomella pinea]